MSVHVVQEDLLQKKRKTIQRGAYWFGIAGRLSILFGLYAAFGFISAAYIAYYSGGTQGYYTLATGALESIIAGWLLLMGRDAFSAIDLLISEMNEVV
jgi:hypothetical protein